MFVLKCPFQRTKLKVSSCYGSKVTGRQSSKKTLIFSELIRKSLGLIGVKQIREKLKLAQFCVFCKKLRSNPHPQPIQSAANQFFYLQLSNSGCSNDLFNPYHATGIYIVGENGKIPRSLQSTVAPEPLKIEKNSAAIKCSSRNARSNATNQKSLAITVQKLRPVKVKKKLRFFRS